MVALMRQSIFSRLAAYEDTTVPEKAGWQAGKKSLQICGAGKASQKVSKMVRAGRGPETKWEMSVQMC
jgi:hypothetical protein